MESKTVLVVEDDLAIRILLTDCLSHEGYKILNAEDGSKALNLLNQLPYPQSLPDLIILDLMMPVMDGHEFRSIQLQSPQFANIPVIVITAGIISEDEFSKLQARAYLKKPFDLDRLSNLIHRYCLQ